MEFAQNDSFDAWLPLPDVPCGPHASRGCPSEERSLPSPARARGSLAPAAFPVGATALPSALGSHRLRLLFLPLTFLEWTINGLRVSLVLVRKAVEITQLITFLLFISAFFFLTYYFFSSFLHLFSDAVVAQVSSRITPSGPSLPASVSRWGHRARGTAPSTGFVLLKSVATSNTKALGQELVSIQPPPAPPQSETALRLTTPTAPTYKSYHHLPRCIQGWKVQGSFPGVAVPVRAEAISTIPEMHHRLRRHYWKMETN